MCPPGRYEVLEYKDTKFLLYVHVVKYLKDPVLSIISLNILKTFFGVSLFTSFTLFVIDYCSKTFLFLVR